VLFDLDGVIVDSYEAWFRSVDDTSREFGFGPVTRERFDSIWGQGIDADVKNLYPGRSAAEVRASYDRTVPRHVAAIRVNPEAASALAWLRTTGLRTACVTNTIDDLARAVLRTVGLGDAFDAVSGARAGLREKPAPDLLLAALRDLDVDPALACMVGDSRYDREGAAAARVRFLHYDLRSGESLLAFVSRSLPPTRSGVVDP
jgi:phosphoglycolate phosphatase